MLVATWAGIGALVLVTIIGWLCTYIKSAKEQAKSLGALEQKVDNLDARVGRIELSLNGLVSKRVIRGPQDTC